MADGKKQAITTTLDPVNKALADMNARQAGVSTEDWLGARLGAELERLQAIFAGTDRPSTGPESPKKSLQ